MKTGVIDVGGGLRGICYSEIIDIRISEYGTRNSFFHTLKSFRDMDTLKWDHKPPGLFSLLFSNVGVQGTIRSMKDKCKPLVHRRYLSIFIKK